MIQSIPGLSRLRKGLPAKPVVRPIPLHQTKQHPMPAMDIDESSIEGTICVVETIMGNILKLSSEDIKKHGLFFIDGDLLTLILMDKVSSVLQQSV